MELLKLAPALLCVWALLGFSSATRVQGQDALPPGAGLRIPVPYVAQVKQGCGSAALAMLLGYWKQQGYGLEQAIADPAHIHAAVYSQKANGSPASKVEDYLKESGFRTFSFSGTWNDLHEHLQNGRPLLLALRSPGSRRQLHYVVAVGISDQQLLVHDPAVRPNYVLGRKEFETRWRASRQWTLLALPPE